VFWLFVTYLSSLGEGRKEKKRKKKEERRKKKEKKAVPRIRRAQGIIDPLYIGNPGERNGLVGCSFLRRTASNYDKAIETVPGRGGGSWTPNASRGGYVAWGSSYLTLGKRLCLYEGGKSHRGLALPGRPSHFSGGQRAPATPSLLSRGRLRPLPEGENLRARQRVFTSCEASLLRRHNV